MAKPRFRARSVSESVESFRRSFALMGIPERDVKVTWDAEANWARLRILVAVPEPRRVFERTDRHDPAVHPRNIVEDTLWVLARWLATRARLVTQGKTVAQALGMEWGHD